MPDRGFDGPAAEETTALVMDDDEIRRGGVVLARKSIPDRAVAAVL
jgi:hypothetical protein